MYQSYLLRLWSARVDDKTVWRATLESALTRQRQGFAGLDDLFDFLRQQTGVSSEQTRVRSDEVGDEAPRQARAEPLRTEHPRPVSRSDQSRTGILAGQPGYPPGIARCESSSCTSNSTESIAAKRALVNCSGPTPRPGPARGAAGSGTGCEAGRQPP